MTKRQFTPGKGERDSHEGEERKRETERDIWPGWILFKNDNGAYGAYTEKSAGGD